MSTLYWFIFGSYFLMCAACSLLSYGWTFAYFHRNYPNLRQPHHIRGDQTLAVFFAAITLLQPWLAFVVFTLFHGAKHGWTFKPDNYE